MCAFPGCEAKLVDEDNDFIAQICHIEAASRLGQRYNKFQSDDERRDIKNLLILCHKHHIKTNDVNAYRPETLREMKARHEARFRGKQYAPAQAALQQARREFDAEWKSVREIEELKHELANALATRERRANYLRDQISRLYGPLSFYLESNDLCFQHSEHLLKNSQEANPNGDPNGPNVSSAIGIAFQYHDIILNNNHSALQLLRDTWAWIDADDIPFFRDFLLDAHRAILEKDAQFSLALFAVGRTRPLKPALIIRHEFLQHVRAKLAAKQGELSGLQKDQ